MDVDIGKIISDAIQTGGPATAIITVVVGLAILLVRFAALPVIAAVTTRRIETAAAVAAAKEKEAAAEVLAESKKADIKKLLDDSRHKRDMELETLRHQSARATADAAVATKTSLETALKIQESGNSALAIAERMLGRLLKEQRKEERKDGD